jgi:sodium/potassium/calcium exchanger 3
MTAFALTGAGMLLLANGTGPSPHPASGGGGGGGLGGGCNFLSDMCLGGLESSQLGWAVVLEVCVFLYAFVGLAIVCDDYLVMSLERVCERLHVREDVAGATFMAFGSAAPEIVVNAVTTLKQASMDPARAGPDQDVASIGVGAIIGSGIIAFMLIPGVCALSVNDDIKLLLKRRPLLRDVGTYAVSLALLCVFFHDGIIQTYESAILVGLYAVYVVVVIGAPKVRRVFRVHVLGKKHEVRTNFIQQAKENRAIAAAADFEGGVSSGGGLRAGLLAQTVPTGGGSLDGGTGGGPDGPLLDEFGETDSSLIATGGEGVVRVDFVNNEADRTTEQEDIDAAIEVAHSRVRNGFGGRGDAAWHGGGAGIGSGILDRTTLMPAGEGAARGESKLSADSGGGAADGGGDTTTTTITDGDAGSCIGNFIWKCAFPLRFLFEWTCPNCEDGSPMERWYPVTFVISFVWVAFFSFIISTVVERWVDLGLHSGMFKMGGEWFGLVLISIGAEIPDAIQSVTVAKRGYGSMAVSNAIGSQIINILIGLGLPWLLTNLTGTCIRLYAHKALQAASFFQFGIVFTFLSLLLGIALVLQQNKAILSKVKARFLILGYFLVIGAFTLLEAVWRPPPDTVLVCPK